MIGYILCATAILSTYLFAKRGLGYGLIAVFAWGYGYGIIRANLASAGSYFTFDAALLTLYCSAFPQLTAKYPQNRTKVLASWVAILAVWPVLLLFLPYQPIEIALVGLRGNIFLLPAILLGVRLKQNDLFNLGRAIAILDILALCFALGEYFWGMERFYPRNNITEFLYRMRDVANFTAFRIPGTFANSASYAAALNTSLPFLYGAWTVGSPRRRDRCLILFGLVASLLGVLLAASRSAFVLLALAVGFATVSGRMAWKKRLTWFLLLAGIAGVAASNDRLQRFTTLRDTDYVEARIGGSVNREFWEILYEYPMGNGLGGGGTSIPYFWESHVRNPVGLESEYSRILLEQSVIGLLLWIGFLAWVFVSSTPFMAASWREGRRLGWFICLCVLSSGMIGVGIFTAVPAGLFVFLMIGWFSAPPQPEAQRRRIGYGRFSERPRALLPDHLSYRPPEAALSEET